MNYLKEIITVILLVFTCSLFAQSKSGFLSGKIIEKLSGDPIIGSVVRTQDDKFGTTSDMDGKYSLKLPEGKHQIIINFISYADQKIEVEIKEGKVVNLDVALEEASVAMDEVVVTYTIQRSSSVAQLIERKNASVVSDGISSEQIKKTPDRTASEALRRVTGASIQEGKFAIIRGMNDRYNSGYLDGAILPSTESDRKAFAFDIIPTNLIDKLQIIKAGTPDIAGDFGGGIIKINTKSIPEKLSQQLLIGGQIHSLTTFKSFNSYTKYSGENWNILNSKRNLPALDENAMKAGGLFPTASEKAQLASNSRLFNLDWTGKDAQAKPNTRFAYSIGCPLYINSNSKMGLVAAINYSNSKKFTASDVASFDGSGQIADLHDNSFAQNISTGGLVNLNFSTNKTQISLNNLMNINTDFSSIQRTGIGNLIDYVEVKNFVNLVSYNKLANSILNIKQIVGNNLFTVEGSVGYGIIQRKIPTYKIASYTKGTENYTYGLALGDFFNNSSGLFSSGLTENLWSENLDFSKKFKNGNVTTELKMGVGMQGRKRSFESRNFVYHGAPGDLNYNLEHDLGKNAISAQSIYLLEKTSDDLAYYNGDQKIYSAYVCSDQRFSEKIRMVYGLRVEKSDIRVSNEKVNMNFSEINRTDILPSLNMTYTLNPNVNLRAAYFSSLNRPEFRELAPFAFYAFDKNAEIKGNKDLKLANLRNYEIRYEWFPSGSQVISAGMFYKNIQNPIELSIDITQPFTTFTFSNEKSATIYGFEFEVRKNLDFLGPQNLFKEFGIFTNLAIIRSGLKFGEGNKSLQDRPLQGQSPYVINCGLQYDSERTGWSAGITLNRIGRRIAFVGVDPKFGMTRQDIYEAPRSILDFQIGKNIGKFNLKCTFGDVLKKDFVFYQDADLNGKYNASTDRRIFRSLSGSSASLNVSYTF